MRERTYRGTVAELHALAMPTEGDVAELWRMHPSAPAVAMGSAQKPEDFDQQAIGEQALTLAARRSGGGAVFIDPAKTVWIDLVAPRTSSWWSAELAENFLIVGRVWQRALASLGVETTLCTSAPVRSDAARLACWAGAGWGELLIGDSKVLGLSQRRTRWGVRVQAMAVLDASSARVVEVLPAADRAVVGPAIATGHASVLAAAGVTAPILENVVLSAY